MTAPSADHRIGDPRLWLEAQGAFAEALATFQAGRPAARSGDMQDVLDAIAPAHQLGFAYCLRADGDSFIAQLLHRGGWDVVTHVGGDGEWWLHLADLLGVVIGLPESIAAVQPEQPAAAPGPTATPAPPAEPDEFEVDAIGPGTPDTPVVEEDRQSLSAGDRETCIALLRALTSNDRQKFQVEFRDHFNVPRTSKTITPHIVQVQHMKFIRNFIDELELSGANG